MAEDSNDGSGELDHGSGTFTHNNAEDLPSQVLSSERKSQSPDHAPDVAQSFEAQATQEREPVSLVKDPDTFRKERSSHAPVPEYDMTPDLAYTDDVDRAKFNDLQSQEDLHATKGQRAMTEHEYQNPPSKPAPMPKADFERARSQPDQNRHVQRGHTR